MSWRAEEPGLHERRVLMDQDAPQCRWGELDPALARQWGQQYLDRAAETGPIPMFGTPEWAESADVVKVAACVLAAYWFLDSHVAEAIEARAERDDLLDQLTMKHFALGFSASRDWGTCRSWDELKRLRTTWIERPPIDLDALARWVKTGSSEPQEAAA
jgi:hypothetical protein